MNNDLEICRKLLLSSAPGQFDAITSNLKIIIPTISEDFINDVRSTYNKKHTIITAETTSTTSAVFNKQEKDEKEDEASTLLLKSIEKKVDEYINKSFNMSEVKAEYTVRKEDSSSECSSYVVQVHCNRIRLENCHTGSFSAVWQFDLTNYTIKGNAELRIHYFEDGNIQLESTMVFKGVTVAQDPSLKSIFRQIGRWENEMISKLESMYENMNDGILKSVRRVLPISKAKFEWNTNLHRMVKCLETKS